MRCKVRKTFRLPPFKSFPLLLLYLYYFMLLYNNNPTCAQRRTALLQPLQHHNNNHGMGNLNKRYRCIIPITIKSFMQARKRASPSLMALCDIGFLLLFDLTYVSRSRNLVSRKSIWKGWLSSGHLFTLREKKIACLERGRRPYWWAFFVWQTGVGQKDVTSALNTSFFNPPLVKLFFLAKRVRRERV